jgi:helix-turn-helix protein
VKYGRYGYRRITALLQKAGWPVGKDRVQRIWRREGLKVAQKQRPRGRLWLGDAIRNGTYQPSRHGSSTRMARNGLKHVSP